MNGKSEYEEEIEQVAEELENSAGLSSPLSKHLVCVGRYIAWYAGQDGKPDKQDFEEFNEELSQLINEAVEEDGVELGDIGMVLWAHLNNIEKMHRKDDGDSGKSENRTADRMFQ